MNDMKKKFIYLLILLLFAPVALFAQRKIKQIDEEKQDQDNTAKSYEKSPFWENVRFGGNLGGSFGNNSSSFLVQPQAFYMVNDNFMAGLGFTYLYWSIEYSNYAGSQTYSYSDHSFGPNLFARHRLFESVFAQAEYSGMNFKSFNDYGETQRVWNNALFIGPGFVQDMGSGGTYIFILYDILWRQDDFSNPSSFSRNYRQSPWDVRIGFYF